MAKKYHFKSLKGLLRWKKKHPKQKISAITIEANRPHVVTQTTTSTKRQQIVSMAHQSLAYAGKMYYSMQSNRSELFHRAKGNFAGAHADCSQFYCSILHWFGIAGVTDKDYTGTLWNKGTHISDPKPGCGVIFGAYPGEHIAMVTEKDSHGVWWCIGFGHQGAPDHVSLPNLKTYFANAGHPGVRYIDMIP